MELLGVHNSLVDTLADRKNFITMLREDDEMKKHGAKARTQQCFRVEQQNKKLAVSMSETSLI